MRRALPLVVSSLVRSPLRSRKWSPQQPGLLITESIGTYLFIHISAHNTTLVGVCYTSIQKIQPLREKATHRRWRRLCDFRYNATRYPYHKPHLCHSLIVICPSDLQITVL
jgi:hypothetical protein